MDPVLKVAQIIELRHLELLGEVNLVRVLLSLCIQAIWHNLAVVSYSHKLAFEQMLFFAWKLWVSFDISLEIPSESILKESGGDHLIRGNQRQLIPAIADDEWRNPE